VRGKGTERHDEHAGCDQAEQTSATTIHASGNGLLSDEAAEGATPSWACIKLCRERARRSRGV
jgi:hypothetical protein